MPRIPIATEEFQLSTKNEMREFWFQFSFVPKQILLLKGEVGAGKTQSVLWLAERFGAHDAASPSFALHNVYAIGGDRPVIDHFDLYRLRDGDDLESTGFWDVFAKQDGLVIIEWPERLNVDELPPGWSITQVEILMNPHVPSPEARSLIVTKY